MRILFQGKSFSWEIYRLDENVSQTTTVFAGILYLKIDVTKDTLLFTGKPNIRTLYFIRQELRKKPLSYYQI